MEYKGGLICPNMNENLREFPKHVATVSEYSPAGDVYYNLLHCCYTQTNNVRRFFSGHI